jgi:hypothetical protein
MLEFGSVGLLDMGEGLFWEFGLFPPLAPSSSCVRHCKSCKVKNQSLVAQCVING